MTTLSPEFKAEAKSLGLADNELDRLVAALGRRPSREELAVVGALWSEHCSYKSSRVHLKRFHTRAPWVLQGPGENAGVYAVNSEWGIAFKMESHNHPSYIEPYQGAATGVGGILRDVFCMGARPIASLNCLRFGEGRWNAHLVKRVVEGIADYGNSVGVPTVCGDTQFHKLYTKNILVNAFTAGLIHKDKIFKGVLTDAEGQRPTVDLEPSRVGTPLDETLKAMLFPEGENVLVYFGSATGRDGVHGATMSSAEFSAGAETLKPTVQVGDPFAEKVLLEATLALIESGTMIGLQDMGAAGLTSSSAEMAGRSGCGVAIDLSAVPLRVRGAGLQAWEILLSESQERMLCAVTPQNLGRVLEILSGFEIPYSVIGRVNQTGRFVCVFQGQVCTDLPVELLTEGAPVYEHPLASREDYTKKFGVFRYPGDPESGHQAAAAAGSEKGLQVTLDLPEPLQSHARRLHQKLADSPGGAPLTLRALLADPSLHLSEILSATLALPAFSGRASLVEHYCATVGGETVLADGAIRTGSAAVVRLPPEAVGAGGEIPVRQLQPGIALAGGCHERWVLLDPLEGSSHSTAAVARKIVATGALPRAMTDCLNFGSPRDPYVMRQISDAIDGINVVARGLEIPVVSGNVSLNNQTDGTPIPPTPMIGIVGDHPDVRRAVPSALGAHPRERQSDAGAQIFVFALMPRHAENHCSYRMSEPALVWGGENVGPLPRFDLALEKALWAAVASVQSHWAPERAQERAQQGTRALDGKSLLQEPSLAFCRPIGRGGVYFAALRAALESQAHWMSAPGLLEMPAALAFGEGQAGFLFGIRMPLRSASGAGGAFERTRIEEVLPQDWKQEISERVSIVPLGEISLKEATAPGQGQLSLDGCAVDGVRFRQGLAAFFGPRLD